MAVAKFRSRARVIDLLGRQQIADAPTAIGELFKNALDAGARNAWIDFLQDEGVLTIRDDGLGMRKDDVLNKWLILATEAKYARHGVDDGWVRFADDEQKKWLNQPSYGEKGIGRLSVATLGRMTLLWSVWGDGEARRGTLCLVHWHLFRHPTKLFEELPIPYVELGNIPTATDIQSLFHELSASEEIQAMLEDEKWNTTLRDELNQDIEADMVSRLGSIQFLWTPGTTFCILGVSDQVEDLFVETASDGSDPVSDFHPDWIKSYHAFSTFWDPFHEHEEQRNFCIHPHLSGEKLKRTHRYWTPEDFKQCDHHIRISVSEDGFAQGFIKNFNSEELIYERQLKSLPRGYQSPGTFLVEVGYVQGKKEHSPLPDDIHSEINKRLIHAGGFSIYLNNVRVQPYGAIDNDFVGFEERRLKNAGRYYFSTRRMFGGIFIPSKEGTRLVEKAGREGFIVNGARKGLRFWVEDIFIDIADTYLGTKANRDDKREKKEEKERAAARIRLEEVKKQYLESVKAYRGWLRDFENEIKRQVQISRHTLASESNGIPGILLNDCKHEIEILQNRLSELHETIGAPPIGVVIEGDALQSVDDYISRREIAILNLNQEIGNQVKQLQTLIARAKLNEAYEKNISERIFSADGKMRQGVSSLLAPTIEKALHLEAELHDLETKEIRKLIEVRENELAGISPKEISRDTTGELAKKLENAIQAQQEAFEKDTKPRLLRLADDVLHLTDNTSGAFILSEQAEELQALKERHAFLIEMAQLGLVYETASHEYEKQVACVRNAIIELSSRLDGASKKILHALSDSFEIIDERIRLFDPLIRRRTSVQEEIRGSDIEEFLRGRFKEYFDQPNLVQITNSFREGSWKNVKRPIFLGSIHNIFHNALYWCHKGVGKPHVRLSSAGELLTISDSGPGVNSVDAKRIFEPGFSRRPFGRGLGLYIAREALRGIGFDLFCPSEPELGALEGANFTILLKNHAD